VTTVSTSKCVTGVQIVAVGEIEASSLLQMRVALASAQLAERAPAVVAIAARYADLRWADRIRGPARKVEGRQPQGPSDIVLDETMVTGRLN